MRAAFLFDAPLPDRLRAVGVSVLLGEFAGVFCVEAPDVRALPADSALAAFREFSAACMEAALVSPAYAREKRAELERRARGLGEKARWLLKPRDAELSGLVAALYAAIGIRVEGDAFGLLRFRRCSFSERYTPELCAFMSAFDSGFVGGLAGGGSLSFDSRITEGASCCVAHWERGT